MRLGKVVGQVVSTAKDPSLAGYSLIVVQPVIGPDAAEQEPFVAVDLVGAGSGEIVLCVTGSGARVLSTTANAAVDCAAVAIADSVVLTDDVVYNK